MASSKKEETSFLLCFHAVFFLISGVALRPCLESIARSVDATDTACRNNSATIVTLVAGWNVAFGALSLRLGYTRFYSYWKFVALVSLFQIFPDWFLVQRLGTLTFPSDAYKIGGAVSWFMAGLWSMPCLWILCSCDRPIISNLDYLQAALISIAIFGLAEQLCHPLQLWAFTDSVQHTWGNVALYVLPAELLLGPILLYLYNQAKHTQDYQQVIAAAAVSFVYTGALAISHLLLEP
jgi:hypothetical protein